MTVEDSLAFGNEAFAEGLEGIARQFPRRELLLSLLVLPNNP
ncbi:MAG: hypothetical protein N0A16_00270 [Blastocatellia bacterium]|nr:hypothetical protein [Blastocatellia bacterium]MCS7156145.1 hypothetical protein [Blastocatellia bacterium]MDW8169217.1 hypothetical protein [Acidobacteriota bacterium]MDW8256078.1 hypothetical protein [Acidobacteriota bacterium]